MFCGVVLFSCCVVLFRIFWVLVNKLCILKIYFLLFWVLIQVQKQITFWFCACSRSFKTWRFGSMCHIFRNNVIFWLNIWPKTVFHLINFSKSLLFLFVFRILSMQSISSILLFLCFRLLWFHFTWVHSCSASNNFVVIISIIILFF